MSTLTIRNRPLHKAVFEASKYIKRGAEVVRCTSPVGQGEVWTITLRWPEPRPQETTNE